MDLRCLDLDDLQLTTEPPSSGGVYALLSKGKPLYIGRSCNIKRRLREHQADPRKAAWFPEVDEVRILGIEGGADPLLVAETGLILKYRPRYCKAIKIGVANDGHLYELQFLRGRRS